MIVKRGAEEIDKIRKAGKIVAATLDKIKKHIRPGVQTKALDRIAREEIIKRNGYPAFKGYRGFPGNICTSINEVIVHGIPSERVIREGDIVSIDIGVRFREYCADAAETFAAGDVSDKARKIMDTARDALYAGIKSAIAGNHLSDISASVQNVSESNGFNVVRCFVGHGIGTNIHEDPEVPNFGRPGMGPALEKGMVLAIEPMINAGTFEVEILEDGWTAVTKDRKLSAHFEHTIAVTDDEPNILTEM